MPSNQQITPPECDQELINLAESLELARQYLMGKQQLSLAAAVRLAADKVTKMSRDNTRVAPAVTPADLTSSSSIQPSARIERLPNGGTRFYYGPPSDNCPLCGGSGRTASSFKIGPDYYEEGPAINCVGCNGKGKRLRD